MKNSLRGFTIIELLIVIVVIGILAAITLVSYNGVTRRAQVVALSDGLSKINKSMILWSIDRAYSTWPLDPVMGGGTALQTMIQTTPSLAAFIQTAPSVTGVQTQDWFYDNDGDSKTNCTNPYNGVNIVIRFVTDQSVAQGVDDLLDDGNLTCGRVRYVDQRIFYTISNGQAVTG